MQRFATLFFVAWVFSLIFTAFAADPVGKIHINEKGEEIICHSTTCYPRMFVPTTTFVQVHHDQVIPTGLHVRLNVGTGGREAKLIDPNDDEGQVINIKKGTDEIGEAGAIQVEASDLVAIPGLEGEDQPDLLNLKTNNGTRSVIEEESKLVQPQEEDEHVKPNLHLSTTDWQSFNEALDTVINGAGRPLKETEDAFELLSESSHETEFGIKIVEDAALKRILKIIVDDGYSNTAREGACITLGNALQNNAVALKSVRKRYGKDGLRTEIIEPLLKAFGAQQERLYYRRLMFTLSRIVRIPDALEIFVTSHGLDLLEERFKATYDYVLRGKIATFLEDEFLNADMKDWKDVSYVSGTTGSGSQKVLKTVDDVPGSGWCEIFQEDLIWKETDVREPRRGQIAQSEGDVLNTLLALKLKYGDKCKPSPGFKEWLKEEKARVEEVEQDEWLKVYIIGNEDAFFRTSSA